MRSFLYSAFAVWIVLVPVLAVGADLTFSAEAFAEYDDNAFRAAQDEEDDVLFRLRPTVRLHEDRGEDARYWLQYAVPFEFAVENGDRLDDIDHHLTGNITYHISDRVEAFGSGALRYLRSGLRETAIEDPANTADTPLINTERERVLQSDASTGFTYNFSPRLASTTDISWDFFDPEREDRARNYLLTGTSSLNYVLAPKHNVGGAIVISHQDFDDRLNFEASTTQAYGVRGQWVYRFDETTTFSINVGPSIIQTKQDDAPVLQTGLQLIPFVDVSGTVSGKIDENGNPFSSAVPVGPGSILVGNFDRCPELVSGQKFFNGGACPLDIVLDSNGAPAGLINAVRNSTVSLANADPEGEDDTSFQVFGEMVLRKDWAPNLHSALKYTREQGGASGLGGSVVRDAVSLANTWEPSERWQFTARADWSLRESVSELSQTLVQAQDTDTTTLVGGSATGASFAGLAATLGDVGSNITLRGDSSQIDTMRWGVSGRATHRFSRNTSAHVQLTYNQQESEGGTLGNVSDFENFLAMLGVRYVFEPIKLW